MGTSFQTEDVEPTITRMRVSRRSSSFRLR
jgi:hypothetical protein